MSKKLSFPKSPLEEILTNCPFLISPNKLKFLSFSEFGTIISLKLISILLLNFLNLLSSLFLFKNLTKLLASNLEPFIKIVFPFLIKKLLLLVATSNLLNDTKLFSLNLNPFILIELFSSL